MISSRSVKMELIRWSLAVNTEMLEGSVAGGQVKLKSTNSMHSRSGKCLQLTSTEHTNLSLLPISLQNGNGNTGMEQAEFTRGYKFHFNH